MLYQSEFKKGIVVTCHPAGAEAGADVLREGGNATDAAAAALMALCVTQPGSVGFGGYGGAFVIYSAANQKVEVIDSDSRAPLAYRPEIFLEHPSVAEHGYLSLGTPGVVAGLDLAIKRFGTMDWPRLARTAIRVAEEGFIVEKDQALGGWTRDADETSKRAIFPDGRIPRGGELWKQPDLARFIRDLVHDPRQFYEGDISRKIVRQVRANGGILSEEDFHGFKARLGEPLHISYRGHDLYTPPPPSEGITSLAILKTLEHFDLASYGPWSAVYFDHFIESARLCWQERDRYLGDPEFVKVPVEEMLSDHAARRRAEQIRKGVTTRGAESSPSLGGEHTVNVMVVDQKGNAVSWTATQGNGFGSHVAIEGLGIFLGHTMSRFDLDPRSPNAAAPGKRVQHNMAPLLVLKNNRPQAVLGLPGGLKIPTVTAQLVVDTIDFKATAGKVVTAPRVHVEAQEPVLLSGQVPEAVAKELELMGHRVLRNQVVGAAANAILIDPATGVLTGGCSKGIEGIGGI